MALFMKQDFTPPILSRRWIAIKFRPNMLIYSRDQVISILESGLLFREDSIEVEQEAPSSVELWRLAGGGVTGWLTKGERIASVLAVAACFSAFPPRNLSRWTFLRTSCYALLPAAIRAYHRTRCRGSLRPLLTLMRDYMTLARRAAACCKEYAALHAKLGSVSSVIEGTQRLLCRQQSELALLMSRASSALLGNAPWLRGDLAWEAVPQDDCDNLMKIHHAFLVVQSTLLKHIAMSHFIPTVKAQKIYINHNERLYWIHNVLIEYLIKEFKDNYESLERMYRLLKNFGTQDNDMKKPGTAIIDNWMYSDVHTGVARSCLELKLALNKCNNLDMFLDSCALNKQDLELDILNKDIEELIDNITKCLSTVQSSQIRLKKLQGKFVKDVIDTEEDVVEEVAILKIEDKEPEVRDEVFYFVKTDDDVVVDSAADIITGPGKKEFETSKIVLNELKRSLVKREDLMRERERQALKKTMPELKNHPEFPRQIQIECDKKGFICKVLRKQRIIKLFRKYKIGKNKKISLKFKLRRHRYVFESDIKDCIFEANAKINVKSKLLTMTVQNKQIILVKWCKNTPIELDYKSKTSITKKDLELTPSCSESDLDDSSSEHIVRASNKSVNHAINADSMNKSALLKNARKDLKLSTSDSDSDDYQERRALLQDVRRHRIARKKNYPSKRPSIDNVDEGLRPIEYSFGTGMAMASVLQINKKAIIPNMAQEEVFIGDGEVSSDSGNDEDS